MPTKLRNTARPVDETKHTPFHRWVAFITLIGLIIWIAGWMVNERQEVKSEKVTNGILFNK
jgi:hypothetical protein